MPYPTRSYIYNAFLNFSHPPDGTKRFFDEYVDDNVHWQVTGQHRFAGSWTTKQEYYNATWAHAHDLIAEPGYKLEVPHGGGEGSGSIILSNANDGWSVVELQSVGTRTKTGGVPYQQHYSWHVRWNEEGKIVQVKVFCDADHLEKVLGGEAAAQQQQQQQQQQKQ